MIRRAVTAKVLLPKHSRPPVRLLTPKDIQKLFAAAAGDRLEAVVHAAVDSGLGQGELFALTWGDFDPMTGALSVTKSLAEMGGKVWVKPTKTEHGRRRVVLSFAVPAMTAHRGRMAAEGRDVSAAGVVFCDEHGEHLRKGPYHRRSFLPVLKRAGLTGLKFHELRHGLWRLGEAGLEPAPPRGEGILSPSWLPLHHSPFCDSPRDKGCRRTVTVCPRHSPCAE